MIFICWDKYSWVMSVQLCHLFDLLFKAGFSDSYNVGCMIYKWLSSNCWGMCSPSGIRHLTWRAFSQVFYFLDYKSSIRSCPSSNPHDINHILLSPIDWNVPLMFFAPNPYMSNLLQRILWYRLSHQSFFSIHLQSSFIKGCLYFVLTNPTKGYNILCKYWM